MYQKYNNREEIRISLFGEYLNVCLCCVCIAYMCTLCVLCICIVHAYMFVYVYV